MDGRVLLFLLVLGTCRCCNARVVTTDFSPVQNGITSALQQINHQQQDMEVETVEEFGEIKELCKLCKKISKPVLAYLSDLKNQKKITSALKKICSNTLFLKEKCTYAVNTYLPTFFATVIGLTPETLCLQIKFCALVGSTSQHLSEDGCQCCHDVVTEVLLKLKDPDIQQETIEVLLKTCDAMDDFEGFAKKCKAVVFIYTPLILGNAELFLERYDVCSLVPACSSATNATEHTLMSSAS